MKNYDDLTNRLLERRDRYVAEQKKKKQRIACTTVSVGSVALVSLAGFALYKNGGFREKLPVADGTPTTTTTTATSTQMEDTTTATTTTPTQTEDTTTAITTGESTTPSKTNPTKTTATTTATGDRIGVLVIDGITYVQCYADENAYTPDGYLGFAHDYEGTYWQMKEVVGRVYTVKEDPCILIVQLSNGGTVVLAAEDTKTE